MTSKPFAPATIVTVAADRPFHLEGFPTWGLRPAPKGAYRLTLKVLGYPTHRSTLRNPVRFLALRAGLAGGLAFTATVVDPKTFALPSGVTLRLVRVDEDFSSNFYLVAVGRDPRAYRLVQGPGRVTTSSYLGPFASADEAQRYAKGQRLADGRQLGAFAPLTVKGAPK